MDTLFKMTFDKKIKKWEYLDKKDFEELYVSFQEDNENNNLYLIQLLENKEFEKIRWYQYILNFIKYIWENYNYENIKIKEILKNKLKIIFELEKPENYSYFLSILYWINKDDKEYYINQYDLLKNENKLYHDINESFLKIFIYLWINNKFIKAFEQIIIDNTINYHSYIVKEWFNYLNSLKNTIFKKYFLELIDFFNNVKQKEKLIDYHEYTWLIKNWEKKDYLQIINTLFKKVENSNFKTKDYDKLFDFLCWDIEFALKNYQRDLLKNYFIKELSSFLFKKYPNFLVKILDKIDKTKILFWMESYIIEYINISDLEKIIHILKWTQSKNIIYFVYDILKQQWKTNLIRTFEESKSIWKQVLKRNKAIEKNNKKFEKVQKDRIQKEKDEFFKMLNPEKLHFYPKLFQDYSNYINSDKWLQQLFDEKEIKNIEKSIQKQIITFLEIINIKDFSDEKIEKIITYKKIENNSYSITAYSTYLSWIIQISRKIKIDFKKYYKVLVLFYPLLRWDNKIEDIFKIIWNYLEEEDINYILKVYSEDLHNKAIWLRYYYTQNLVDFYNKFESEFKTISQKQKLEKICLDIINWDDEDNIYYKEGFLKIYSKIWWKTKFIRLWKKWKEKYSNFNYFIDILENENQDKNDIDKMKFLTFINKELILSFQDKNAILWRIEQIKNWKIECKDELKIEYPYTSTWMMGISSKYSELDRFWRGEYQFSYIFSHIPKVDIKKEILDLLKLSFKIQSDLIPWRLKWDFEMYYWYLRKIFFEYINNLDKSLVEKDYYYKIKSILDDFDYKITYNFNLEDLREKLGIDNFEEEAKDIIEKEWIKWVIKLLKEKSKLNDNLIDEQFKNYTWSEKSNINDKKYILFVEWESDRIILETARDKLYWSLEKNFIIKNWFDCYHIWRWFKEENYWFLDSNLDDIIIWMLDYDSAFEQQRRLLEMNKWQNWKLIEENDIKWRLVKHNKKNWYVFLLPVPLERLEYANYEYESKSLLSIELLFSDKVLNWYMENIKLPWWNILLKMSNKSWKKIKFARFTNTLPKEEFINFIPIFNLIDKIIQDTKNPTPTD